MHAPRLKTTSYHHFWLLWKRDLETEIHLQETHEGRIRIKIHEMKRGSREEEEVGCGRESGKVELPPLAASKLSQVEVKGDEIVHLHDNQELASFNPRTAINKS